jgi:N-acetylmuramoyl-L-alanine amidase
MRVRRNWYVIPAVALAANTLNAAAKESGAERKKVDAIIIHAIGGPECSPDNKKIIFKPVKGDAATWKKYFAEHDTLGIHWIIDRRGTTLAGVPEKQIANHAKGSNETSIGIELVNDGDSKDPYTKEQVDAVVKLIREIRARWVLPLGSIKRHSDVDTEAPLPCGSPRKVDPGKNFPFEDVVKRSTEK